MSIGMYHMAPQKHGSRTRKRHGSEFRTEKPQRSAEALPDVPSETFPEELGTFRCCRNDANLNKQIIKEFICVPEPKSSIAAIVCQHGTPRKNTAPGHRGSEGRRNKKNTKQQNVYPDRKAQ